MFDNKTVLWRWCGTISEELNAVVGNMDEWCSEHLSGAAGISSPVILLSLASVMLKTLTLLFKCYKGSKYAVEVGGLFVGETTKCSRCRVQWSILPASLMNRFVLTCINIDDHFNSANAVMRLMLLILLELRKLASIEISAAFCSLLNSCNFSNSCADLNWEHDRLKILCLVQAKWKTLPCAVSQHAFQHSISVARCPTPLTVKVPTLWAW